MTITATSTRADHRRSLPSRAGRSCELAGITGDRWGPTRRCIRAVFTASGCSPRHPRERPCWGRQRALQPGSPRAGAETACDLPAQQPTAAEPPSVRPAGVGGWTQRPPTLRRHRIQATAPIRCGSRPQAAARKRSFRRLWQARSGRGTTARQASVSRAPWQRSPPTARVLARLSAGRHWPGTRSTGPHVSRRPAIAARATRHLRELPQAAGERSQLTCCRRCYRPQPLCWCADRKTQRDPTRRPDILPQQL